MGHTVLIAIVVLGASALGAAAQQSRSLTPRGGMWQSLPYTDEQRERANGLEPSPPAIVAPPKIKRVAALEPKAALLKSAAPKSAAPKAAAPKTAPKTPRNPVAAATPPEAPARPSAAGKTRELSRRLEALVPGSRLDQPIADPENPNWRRAHAGSPGAETRTFAVPFDDSGRSGFVARGYHQNPTWENPRGNIGATFGLRTKF